MSAFAELILLKSRFLDVLLGKEPPKALLVAPFKGFLGVYDIVDYGSDFLSYTRLAALGLASLMVGDAMNRLAELAAISRTPGCCSPRSSWWSATPST